MGLFSRFQRRKKQKINEKQQTRSQLIEEGSETQNTQEEIEVLKLLKQQQEEVFRKQQEEGARELENLGIQVDNVLSNNSEEFLKNVKQPGGQ